MAKLPRAYPAAWLFLLWIAIGGAFMFLCLHPQAEDVWKFYDGREFRAAAGLPFEPLSVVGCFLESYLHPNGRICEGVVQLLPLHLPKWAIAILWGATFTGLLAACMRLINRATGVSARNVLLFGVLFLLSVPFQAPLLLVTYFVPYIMGALIVVGCLLLFMRLNDGPIKASTLSAAIPLTVLAGCWHEGNGGILLAALLAAYTALPKGSHRQGIILIGALTAGIAIDLAAPGLHERSQGMGLGICLTNWFQPMTLTGGVWLMPHCVVPLLFLCSVATALLFRGVRRRLGLKSSPRSLFGLPAMPLWGKTIFSCAAGVTANLLLLLVMGAIHVSTVGNVLSAIGLTILAARLLRSLNADRRRRTALRIIDTALTLCAVILSANILYCITVQRKLSAEHARIERMYVASPDGVVYFDPTPWPNETHYPWQWVRNCFYTDLYTMLFLKDNPLQNHHRPLRLLPTALLDLPDSVKIEGITRIGDNLLTDRAPLDGETSTLMPGEIDFLKYNIVERTRSGATRTTFYELIPLPCSPRRSSAVADRQLYYLRPVVGSHSYYTDPTDSIVAVLPSAYW